MRLVSYVPAGSPAGTSPMPGVLVQDGTAVLGLDRLGVTSLLHLLQRWDEVLPDLRALVQSPPSVPALPLAHLRLVAPVPDPPSVTAVGLNYRDHAAETGHEPPGEPTFFLLHPASVVGPDADVEIPAQTSAVDYEAELAVVIGRGGHRVPVEEAADDVAGYAVFNDLSARDVQRRMKQWGAAKSFAGFSPLGPWLVTSDEVGDPQALDVTTTVNGEVLQSSSTKEMVFSCAELVSRISHVWPLRPGDVIATGTPAGVGVARTPQRFLADGDVVEVAITGLGTLRTTLRAPAGER